MLRAPGASAAATAPRGGITHAFTPYGGPPPSPGAPGGVGIKRQMGRASSSTDPMEMEVDDSHFYGGPPPPPPRVQSLRKY